MKNVRRPLSIRISSLEKNALKMMAEQDGVCPAEMMRILLREGSIRRGIQPLIFAAGANEIIGAEVQHENT